MSATTTPSVSNTVVIQTSPSNTSITTNPNVLLTIKPSMFNSDPQRESLVGHRTWVAACACPSRTNSFYKLPFALPLTPAVIWHLRVWSAGRVEEDGVCAADLLYLPVGTITAEPLFRSRDARDRFAAWWRRYSALLGENPAYTYIPALPRGRLAGDVTFVDSPCSEADSVLAKLTSPALFLTDHTRIFQNWEDPPDIAHAMTKLLPEWSWIAANARRPAYRIHGGYLFTRRTDAAKFLLTREHV